MANKLQRFIQNEAYQLVFLQLIGVFLLAFICFAWRGYLQCISVLAGGLSYGFANLIFVWAVFRFVGARQANQFVMAFFFGEVVKLALSAFLFLIIVKYLQLSLLSVLLGFIGAIVAFWLGCTWQFSRKSVAV